MENTVSKYEFLGARSWAGALGKQADEAVTVYTVDGRVIYHGTADVIEPPTRGLYIVTVRSRSHKISLK